MFISAFCNICELKTEREIVFYGFLDSQRDMYNTGSQMGSQPLQNMEIIKQTDLLLWKI